MHQRLLHSLRIILQIYKSQALKSDRRMPIVDNTQSASEDITETIDTYGPSDTLAWSVQVDPFALCMAIEAHYAAKVDTVSLGSCTQESSSDLYKLPTELMQMVQTFLFHPSSSLRSIWKQIQSCTDGICQHPRNAPLDITNIRNLYAHQDFIFAFEDRIMPPQDARAHGLWTTFQVKTCNFEQDHKVDVSFDPIRTDKPKSDGQNYEKVQCVAYVGVPMKLRNTRHKGRRIATIGLESSLDGLPKGITPVDDCGSLDERLSEVWKLSSNVNAIPRLTATFVPVMRLFVGP